RKTTCKRTRRTLCFFFGGFIYATLPYVAPIQSVTYLVGNEALLPCNCTSMQIATTCSPCHIQWLQFSRTVYETDETGKEWQNAESTGRLSVPRENNLSGNCSLIIRNVSFADATTYTCLIIAPDKRLNNKLTRYHIQSIRLLVTAHTAEQSHRTGEDFVIELYTSESSTVLFQRRNSSLWLNVFTRDGIDDERIVKDPQYARLTLQKVRPSDEGTYKILTADGTVVSIVQLTVREEFQPFANDASSNVASNGKCAAPLMFLLLYQMFLLLIL
uniref:Ig-like domain-containing protein n=1 Tax=Nothobranchius furzeri TaxID=105023 RepID=A0A8C6P565_NOTFU